MIKIKTLTAICFEDFTNYTKGSIIDVPKEKGIELINAGYAELVITEEPISKRKRKKVTEENE